MFGWLKRKSDEVRSARAEVVSEAADQAVNFALGLQAALGGFPKRLLNDPFIVGAISMYAAVSAKVMTNGQATNVMIEAAMIEALVRAFIGKGVERHEAIGSLMRFKNDPEYAKAVQVVTLILGARFERKDLVHDPLLSEAKANVRAMPKAFRQEFGATEAEQIAYELTRRHFIEPMKSKHGELWRNPGDA